MPTAITYFKELNRGLMHLFYPRLCEGCNRPLAGAEKVLCLDCEADLPQTNYHHVHDNETALRFSGRIPFVHATSFAWFTDDGLLQHLLHGLKYKNKKDTGYYLGRQLGLSLRQAQWGSGIDAIIPVPLHKRKEARRGYNQSLLIAEGLGEALGIPVAARALVRVRDTESQTRKSRTARVNNMAEAFTVKDDAAVAGRHLLLIDDVLTTGATLEACALALLKVKGVKMSIATIGIAV